MRELNTILRSQIVLETILQVIRTKGAALAWIGAAVGAGAAVYAATKTFGGDGGVQNVNINVRNSSQESNESIMQRIWDIATQPYGLKAVRLGRSIGNRILP